MYDTPVGKIYISDNGSAITQLGFCRLIPQSELVMQETEILKKAAKQLEEYFAGLRTSFELPIDPQGTPFQKSVWNALVDIPYGETRSYKDIAEAVGCPKGFRAIGLANNKNPIAIIIPCHRVIGASGKLIGYAGGINIKDQLLKLERTC